jgi:hypothetical protein
MKKTTAKKKRPPSPKMLRHLRRVAKLLHQRAVDRRKAAEAKKAKDRDRKKTKRATASAAKAAATAT